MLKILDYRTLLLLCTVGLAACTGVTPVPPAANQSGQSATARVVPAAELPQTVQRYAIDAAATTLHILVYRGGTLARLGHNHVISSRNVHGSVWHGQSLQSSGFAITVPVNTLIVDDNAARAAEGEDFPLNVTEDAKQGTKANMLRDTLLDGARYPDITITSVRVDGNPQTPQVLAALRIKDQTRQVVVPVRLLQVEGNLHIEGEFAIQQTDFGITPLSVAMGALLVQDTLRIKFKLVTRPA